MILSNKALKELQEQLKVLSNQDIANHFEDWSPEKRIASSRLLTKDRMANVFHLLSPTIKKDLLSDYTQEETKELIQQIESDDLVDTLQELPANMASKLLNFVDPVKRPLINQLLGYPEESVGSLMSIDYVLIHEDSTVAEALDKIQHASGGPEHLYQIYVMQSDRKLTGYIYLSDLIQSQEEMLTSMIHYDIQPVQTHMDQEIAADLFNKYQLHALPVVDLEGRLVGQTTADDIFRVIHQESEEDISIMAGLTSDQENTPYLEQSFWSMAKQRIAWLLFLMISATFTGYVIQEYEALLATHVVLAAYIPMLMDSGGNAGTQSSTLVTRALSNHEVETTDWKGVLVKELQVGLTTGIVMAVINFIRLALFDHVDLAMGLTVCTALIVTIILSKLLGGLLPVIAEYFNQDPAVMAGPLITTIVDTITLILYFQIATFFLGI